MKFFTIILFFLLSLVAATPLSITPDSSVADSPSLLVARATVRWADRNAHKNDQAKKAKWEGIVSGALDRAGLRQGTIRATVHRSPSDRRPHVTVDTHTRTHGTVHIYENGKGTRIVGGKAKPLHRRVVVEETAEEEGAGWY